MTTRRAGTFVVSWVAVAVAVAGAVLVDRGRRPSPCTDQERAPSSPRPSLAEGAPAGLAPPTPADVRAALARAFSRCVECPAQGAESAFGDFNGDGWQDVVVVVQPSEERAHEINDDLRNWIVQDLGRKAGVRVEIGEKVLAVIHGHGRAGWRGPEARQAYLLKNAAGMKLGVVRKEAMALTNHAGRVLRGDVIAQEAQQVPRLLYWTGAGYAFWR